MKRTLLGACLGVVSLVGCVETTETSSTAGQSFEAFKAGVYVEPGTGFYILDWDTVLTSEDELREFHANLQQGALSIYSINGVDQKWDATQKKNLTYCVSDAFGATRKARIIADMSTATDLGWEKFADVNFIHVAAQDATCNAQNNNVLFDVNPVDSGGQYLARAFFPDDARAARNVLVDNTAFDPAQTGNIPLANILGHELGHVLGMRHEHIRPEAAAPDCAEDNQFRGLTTYDSLSVMHYPQCGANSAATTLAFTARDQQGIALVYGAPGQNMPPSAQVTFPADNATVAPTFLLQASIVDTDITSAELLVDGTSYMTKDTGPFNFQVTDLGLGSHALEIKATDSSGQTTSTTLTITVAAGGDDGNGGGGSGSGSGSGSGTGGGNNSGPNDVVGGCSTGGSTGGLGFVLALGLVGLIRRRR